MQCLDAQVTEISKGTRKQILKSQFGSNLCFYCGKETETEEKIEKGAPKKYTIDHVWPRALGGTSDAENLVLSCEAVSIAVFFATAKDISKWSGVRRVVEHEEGNQRIRKPTRVNSIKRFSCETLKTQFRQVSFWRSDHQL